MRTLHRLVAGATLAIATVLVLPTTAPAQTDEPVDDAPDEVAVEEIVTVETAVADTVKLGEWIDAYSKAKWYEGINAAAAARAAAARPGSYHPGTTTGECSGFAIPDYIIQRESGGNPSAYNPSGAYGCAQTLLSHYSRGSCTGLDPYNIDGQRECVNRLSNGGTNLRPWDATR